MGPSCASDSRTPRVTVFGEAQVPGPSGLRPIGHDGVAPSGSVAILGDRLLYLFALLRAWSLNAKSLGESGIGESVIGRHQKYAGQKYKLQHSSTPCASATKTPRLLVE
jgi:hypothetical protein